MARHRHEASELLPSIAAMIMDRATSTATVVMTDGRTESRPLVPSPFSPSSIIVRARYVPSTNRLYLETDRGHAIDVELPTLRDSAPRGGRPVVYLDQRDWSLLANVLFEPERVHSKDERDAAERLIDLARARKIIVPMSFAHLGETSKWTNTDRKYRLALTVAQLSQGWQMRHPLDIRRYELRQSFATSIKQNPLPPLDVFTLEGCAAQAEWTSQERYEAWAGFPVGIAHAGRSLTCILSYIDLILDSEATAITPIPAWVSGNRDITDWFASQSTTSSQKRRSIGVLFLHDIRTEVAKAAHECGMTNSELETWVDSHFHADVRVMGSLDIANEIYQDKHLKSGTTWSDNDLTDMMFLTCAAGYAEYVVGERSLMSYVKQAAKRLGRPIKVYSRISDLLAALKTDGL